ncbi:unnamed protein product [Effrenium voratum]|uniref:Uncharacterized protein n=1 Tax=Effrenium voratum TaxID=2562239 RepID=A0AA36IZK1_9DINO|nr:unnamed protein product [Effrenium voratum]
MDWSVGVLGADGQIYCVPDTANEVLRYDPKTRQSSRFGSDVIDVGTHKWSGGILAPDGKIYCVPWTHPQVLVIDAVQSKVSFLDTSAGSGCEAASMAEHKWRDCVLASDGCIYCVPWTAEAVLCIDVQAGRASCFAELPQGESKWAGAAVGCDGRIYCAPYDSCSVLCISPREKSAMLLGHFGSLRRKWRPAKRTNALQRRVLRSRRGAVAANGYIYMVPCNALEVLAVDPRQVVQISAAPRPEVHSDLTWAQATARRLALGMDEDEEENEDEEKEAKESDPGDPRLPAGFLKFGWVGGIRCKWRGGVMANGYIFCVPDCASEVLCIRPDTQDVICFGEVGSARWKWRGGVLAADGKIYCAPYEPHEPTLAIDPAKLGVVAMPAFDGKGLQLPGFVESSQGEVLPVPL